VKAANAAIKRGSSEEEAIFACIGAAGKSYKQVNEEEYDSAVEDGLKTFQDLMAAYFAGLITLSILNLRFKEAIEIHFMRLMVLGLDGKAPTQQDLDFVQGKIDQHTVLFDVFLTDLANKDISENRALWRAGLYATDREAYIFYTVPNAVVSLMEGLPGEICLGNGLCGCHLDVQFDTEGNATVNWIVDPIKESCEVCLGMQARSPFTFSREEIERVG
jgi:hypothetical protein